MATHDVLVLGAGVAGLQCARRLSGAGADLLVVDRSDKPGGRCATRLFDGEPADYGPLFVHGDDPGFLAAVDAVPAQRLPGWPARVNGRGTPCQPDAFAPFQTRVAFQEGVNAFPHALAQGLPMRLRAQAATVEIGKDGVSLTLADGDRLQARDLVLALALEQAVPFLRQLGQADRDRSATGALGVLEMFASIPCLTLGAGYDDSAPLPDWDICYPEDEPDLLLMSNESSKRPGTGARVLVFQASARWSLKRLERQKEEWGRELLGIVSHRLGPWAAAPRWTHLHRWRYSRLDRANELSGPLELRIGRSRVGIIGDLFSPGGGLQSAWLSGDRLGSRLVQ
jgi:predicted NAD/FAD-dependent oxidoreductase